MSAGGRQGPIPGTDLPRGGGKSIINPIPYTKNMPFEYTINCYRGCSHDLRLLLCALLPRLPGLNIAEDFDRKIVVKINAVELVRAQTEPRHWAGRPIAMGTNTDPYQPAEGKYRLTRGIVEVLTERGNPFSVLTKSPWRSGTATCSRKRRAEPK